jgi:hypothetical protein
MAVVKRLPSHPHHRVVTLVRDSMPTRDYREFPEPAARVLRASAVQRAVCYAAIEETADTAARVAEELASSDGIVVDLTDDDAARSIAHHLERVGEAAAALVDEG